jgi:glycosyltransferase involved in cell wall biosynthesis
MVVLEAMACGLSILIANSPTSASPGFVKNNGYVFAPHDAKDLAQKIEKLISDPELLADMRKASLDNVKDFAFTTSVEKLESFLLSFIQK